MERQRKIFWAKTAAILAVIPALLWAYASGPLPGKAGVPGESTCNEVGCHVGTAVNGGPGSVTVTFPNGQTYTPGVKQHLVVTIADPNQRNWGFQLAARLASDSKSQAGAFKSTDSLTGVVCGQSPTDLFPTYLDFPAAQNCPGTKPYTYIEHTGNGASRVSVGSGKYEFDWTPPATDVGNIVLYVAGNAANANGTETGDRIYTKNYTLTSGAATPTPVLRASNPVQDAINNRTQIVPGSWVAVYGTNFADVPATGKDWTDQATNGHFPNNVLPTTVASVQVLVNDAPAPVWYVFPGQVNFQAPTNISGTATVKVVHNGSASSAATVNVAPVSPGVISYSADFQTFYPSAQFANTTNIVGDPAVFGNAVKKAKPGDAIVIYVTGLASTQCCVEITNFPSFTTPVTVNIGSTTVTPLAVTQVGPGYWALGFLVPSGLAPGNYNFTITTNGQTSQSGVVFVVGS